MGLIEDIGSGPVGLDTAIFIYFIEEHPRFLPVVEPLFVAIDAGPLEGVTSGLTLLETLVVPYRAGDTALADRYEALLTGAVASSCSSWTGHSSAPQRSSAPALGSGRPTRSRSRPPSLRPAQCTSPTTAISPRSPVSGSSSSATTCRLPDAPPFPHHPLLPAVAPQRTQASVQAVHGS